MLRNDLQREVASIQSKMDELDGRDREALRAIDAFDLGLLSAKSAKANEVIRWKSFSWTRLFNRLQEIQPWDVQMTAIRPVFNVTGQAADRQEDFETVPVSVEGVAKTPDDFWKLQAALIFEDHFDRVEPQHTTLDTVSGETVFRLTFNYDPRELPTDEEREEAETVAESDADPVGTTAAPDTALVEIPVGEAADAWAGVAEDTEDPNLPQPAEEKPESEVVLASTVEEEAAKPEAPAEEAGKANRDPDDEAGEEERLAADRADRAERARENATQRPQTERARRNKPRARSGRGR